jgi:hypothetical protein
MNDLAVKMILSPILRPLTLLSPASWGEKLINEILSFINQLRVETYDFCYSPSPYAFAAM